MYRPNVILVSVREFHEGYKEIFDYLNQKCIGIPIFCFGTKEDLACIDSIPEGEALKRIQSPIMVKDVIAIVNESLGISKEVEEPRKEEVEEKKTILLVDDVAVQLRAVESILKESYKVRMATSGRMAIEMLRKSKPDLILLDYDMPDWDGKKTLELIRNEENGQEVPIVFVTGVSEKNRIMEVLKLAPAGYLVKPVERNKLLEMVHQVLGI